MHFPYEKILARGRSYRKLYESFLRSLKKRRGVPLQRFFDEANHIAFERIDCTRCGLCCTGLGPKLNPRDIDRLARTEKSSNRLFFETYLREDEDGDIVFRELPCPFFGTDGLCLVYDSRPHACRDYPHLESTRSSRELDIHRKNLSQCPAVVLAVEWLMEEIQSL